MSSIDEQVEILKKFVDEYGIKDFNSIDKEKFNEFYQELKQDSVESEAPVVKQEAPVENVVKQEAPVEAIVEAIVVKQEAPVEDDIKTYSTQIEASPIYKAVDKGEYKETQWGPIKQSANGKFKWFKFTHTFPIKEYVFEYLVYDDVIREIYVNEELVYKYNPMIKCYNFEHMGRYIMFKEQMDNNQPDYYYLTLEAAFHMAKQGK